MIEEFGTVVQVDGERACVEVLRVSACGSCSARQGCGTGSLAKLFGVRPLQLWMRNEIDARVGDRVVLGIEEGALVSGSLMVYLLPLIALLACAAAGQAVATGLGIENGEPFALLGGLGGLAAALGWLRSFGMGSEAQRRFEPILVRRL